MAVDYNNTVLHVGANIAYEEGENKEENQTAYNDKVVHADVTINDTMDRKIEEALTLLNDKVDQRLAELEARVAALENKNN